MRGGVALRRLDAVERGETLVFQHALYGAKPVRTLRMAGRRDVLQVDRVGIEPGDHDPI